MRAACSFAIMKKLLPALIAIASIALGSSALAKKMKLPSDEFSIASIDFPSDWEPEEINNGAAGQSPDSAVYFAAVAVGSDKGMEAELNDTFDMLKEHKVELDKTSKQESKFELNGEQVQELIFHGKDEDGPCSVSISFVPLKDKVIVLTYWVTSPKRKNTRKKWARFCTA